MGRFSRDVILGCPGSAFLSKDKGWEPIWAAEQRGRAHWAAVRDCAVWPEMCREGFGSAVPERADGAWTGRGIGGAV